MVAPIEAQHTIDLFVGWRRHTVNGDVARQHANVVTTGLPARHHVVARKLVSTEVMRWIHRAERENAGHNAHCDRLPCIGAGRSTLATSCTCSRSPRRTPGRLAVRD